MRMIQVSKNGCLLALGAVMLLAGACGGTTEDSESPAPLPVAAQAVETLDVEESDSACRRDFDATLQKHLQAIQQRDLVALEKTLTRSEDLYLFLPNGTLLTTRTEFLDFHREFFAGTTWTQRMDPLRTVYTPTLATVAFHTRYDDSDGPDGKPYFSESYLTLTFARQNGRWGLVQDQNTRIKFGSLPAGS